MIYKSASLLIASVLIFSVIIIAGAQQDALQDKLFLQGSGTVKYEKVSAGPVVGYESKVGEDLYEHISTKGNEVLDGTIDVYSSIFKVSNPGCYWTSSDILDDEDNVEGTINGGVTEFSKNGIYFITIKEDNSEYVAYVNELKTGYAAIEPCREEVEPPEIGIYRKIRLGTKAFFIYTDKTEEPDYVWGTICSESTCWHNQFEAADNSDDEFHQAVSAIGIDTGTDNSPDTAIVAFSDTENSRGSEDDYYVFHACSYDNGVSCTSNPIGLYEGGGGVLKQGSIEIKSTVIYDAQGNARAFFAFIDATEEPEEIFAAVCSDSSCAFSSSAIATFDNKDAGNMYALSLTSVDTDDDMLPDTVFMGYSDTAESGVDYMEFKWCDATATCHQITNNWQNNQVDISQDRIRMESTTIFDDDGKEWAVFAYSDDKDDDKIWTTVCDKTTCTHNTIVNSFGFEDYSNIRDLPITSAAVSVIGIDTGDDYLPDTAIVGFTDTDGTDSVRFYRCYSNSVCGSIPNGGVNSGNIDLTPGEFWMESTTVFDDEGTEWAIFAYRDDKGEPEEVWISACTDSSCIHSHVDNFDYGNENEAREGGITITSIDISDPVDYLADMAIISFTDSRGGDSVKFGWCKVSSGALSCDLISTNGENEAIDNSYASQYFAGTSIN